mmetsp:Transcript_6963/g.11222  ORF Transcript_6963/g.11222 Transcript_6963/m.11222 type:complete len:177 (+) Transcript_6963:59-589(+)
MCGCGASAGTRYTEPQTVHGKHICDNSGLRSLMKNWSSNHCSFTGAILKADNKETLRTYVPEKDKWESTEKLVGDISIVLKTVSHGFLQLQVTSRGFQWEYLESYRSQPTSCKAQQKIVNSCKANFKVADFTQMLESQRGFQYRASAEPPDVLDYASFAKNLFEALSGKKVDPELP